MPLAAGERVGPYEIAEKIGAIGAAAWGEVYRGRDTRPSSEFGQVGTVVAHSHSSLVRSLGNHSYELQ